MKSEDSPRLPARLYRVLTLAALGGILLHLGIRLIFKEPTPLPDLYLFNLLAGTAALSALTSPLFNDRWAVAGIGCAIGIWTLGSTLSTAESFYYFHLWRGFSDIAYALFYPLMLLGLIRAISSREKLSTTTILDVTIIGLGASSALASLLLKPAMIQLDGSAGAVFLAILYPIGDIFLFIIVLLAIALQKISLRPLLLLLGMAIFATTDLYFIWRSATSAYPFASIIDDGWVLGLILIAEALWHPASEQRINPKIVTSLTMLAVIASSLLLGIAVVHPSELPRFVLIPAFGTIAFAFIRMTIALREAHEIKDERELARTDELTGLPNRRRFITALDNLNNTEAVLLLLDLDGFKNINDTLGHDAGDELLRQIALRFQRQIPKSSIIARLGGDEFGAIIYGSKEHGLEIAQALRASLAYPADIGTHSIEMSVSIGAVVNDGQPELMRRADQAMYASKQSHNGVTLVGL